ncbi:serine/threonine-protein kinase [Haliea sp. E1-2-M8]|uniref:serine/threonine-protein kinase n=1 Tax=Haliea sp. E1-2-M8 TaxID=3064706 RepID=UPI002716A854|nr:serine/threonine-protein kinase [Haliea sp. E1-2-M8]MDO8861425.1 serine/threonine-protein kinase [Haliea sp. E1-2-M8]
MSIEDRIGPYRILRLIRRGEQGSIFLGFDDRLDRRVVAKLYSLPADPARSKRVLQEAQLVAGLDSPRVVGIYDVIVGETHLAMIMEYVPGCDLEELLGCCDLSLASILLVASDVAAAIALARQQRIVHGDLKPSNVLVTTEGRVKLTDFGIAQAQGSAHSRRGSPSSVSPEQLRGRPLDVRSDLFALGCLLYRLLAGQHPYLKDGAIDAAALLGGAPPLPPTLADGTPVPDALSELVCELLAADPERRPQNTHEVRQRLHEIASGLPRTLHFPLAEEARPAFREETADELPLQIPGSLRHQGRSRMPLRPGQWSLFGIGRDWRRRQWLAAAVVALVALAWLLVGLWPASYRVHVPLPEVVIEVGAVLPEGRDTHWLLDQVRDHALRIEPGLVFSGELPPFRSRSLDRSLATLRQAPPPEQLRVALHCQQAWCILGLERERATWRRYRQALLLVDAPAAHWQQLIGLTVAELFAADG